MKYHVIMKNVPIPAQRTRPRSKEALYELAMQMEVGDCFDTTLENSNGVAGNLHQATQQKKRFAQRTIIWPNGTRVMRIWRTE